MSGRLGGTPPVEGSIEADLWDIDAARDDVEAAIDAVHHLPLDGPWQTWRDATERYDAAMAHLRSLESVAVWSKEDRP